MQKINVVCATCLKINKIPKKDSYKKALCGECKNSLLEKNILDVNEYNLDHILINSDIPVIIDFWAPWCGPCKSFSPIFEETSKSFVLKALFIKINTQEEQNIAQKYGIQSIPTLVIFKNAEEIKRVSGLIDPTKLSILVQDHL